MFFELFSSFSIDAHPCELRNFTAITKSFLNDFETPFAYNNNFPSESKNIKGLLAQYAYGLTW